MKAKTWAFVMLALMVWVGAAQAATVSHTWSLFGTYTTTGSVPSVGGTGTQNSMNIALANVQFSDPLSNFIGFCVAPTVTLSNGSYSFEFLSWNDAYYRAAHVMDNAPSVSDIDSNFGEVRQVRAVQSAIWAALENNQNYVPRLASHGWASPRSSDLFNAAMAASISSDWDSVTATLSQKYSILQLYTMTNDGVRINHQTLLINRPVPVPAAVWMLGSGLLAVVVMRRKRQV